MRERLLADEIPPPPGGGSALADRSTSLLVVGAVVLALAGVGLALVALRDGTDNPDGDFVRCIERGHRADPDLHTAVRAHRIVDAIYRSAAHGGTTQEVGE